MTDAERERLAALERRVESAHRILPDLVESVRALAAQNGAGTAEAIAARRDIDRLTRAIDGPPSLDTRIAAAMQAHKNAPPSPKPDGWHDNAERGLSAVLGARWYSVLLAAFYTLVAGLVVVVAILAWKGDLDDVIRGAFTPGAEVVDVPPEVSTPTE